MVKKQKPFIYFFIMLLLVGVVALLIVTYINRKSAVCKYSEIAHAVENDIESYRQLGFAQNSELISLLQGKLQRAQDQIATSKKQWFIKTARPDQTPISVATINQLINLNKKMLINYVTDIQEYKKFGFKSGDPIIRFSYDKVVRLTIALAELQRQLRENSMSTSNEYGKKVARMHEITLQSIAQLKEQLHTYKKQGTNIADEKVQFTRNQITQKIRAAHQIETLNLIP